MVTRYTFLDDGGRVVDVLESPSPQDCAPASTMDYCGGCPRCLLMQTDLKKWEADGRLITCTTLAKRGLFD